LADGAGAALAAGPIGSGQGAVVSPLLGLGAAAATAADLLVSWGPDRPGWGREGGPSAEVACSHQPPPSLAAWTATMAGTTQAGDPCASLHPPSAGGSDGAASAGWRHPLVIGQVLPLESRGVFCV